MHGCFDKNLAFCKEALQYKALSGVTAKKYNA